MLNDNSNLYDSVTQEVFLIDNAPIQGRKADLRQLMKLLNLAKNGQPKGVLICGEPGIGKTELLDAFVDITRKGLYCRVIRLGQQPFKNVEELYSQFIESLQVEANHILDEALTTVNEITQELGLHWERQDLIRSVALVKLQESIGGKEAVTQERLIKAIRSSVPTVKKLKFSTVNDSIEKLVGLIVNPWLLIASSLANPLTPQLQEAVALAQKIRHGYVLGGGNDSLGALPQRRDADVKALGTSDADKGDTALDVDMRTHGPSGPGPFNMVDSVDAIDAIDAVNEPQRMLPAPINPDLLAPEFDESLPYRDVEAFDCSVEHFSQHVIEILNFINRTIQGVESAVLLVVDDWDRVAGLPEREREELKEFLAAILRDTTDRKTFNMMMLLSARSQGESYSLGGPLYSLCRNKLLLTGLPPIVWRKYYQSELKDRGLTVDEPVLDEVGPLTMGNPLWLKKMLHFLGERAAANGITRIDGDFFNKLGIDKPEDILEAAFTQLKLSFINNEGKLFTIIAALAKQFGYKKFKVQEAITELSASQQLEEAFVCDVLRSLFHYDFIAEIPRSGDIQELNPKGLDQDPLYKVESRAVLEFLEEKTRAVQTDVSTDEKLGYLKKIIPLSVKSGELDREKTMEVLALSESIGDTGMIEFLEETFLEYLQDSQPIVRVTALNNIAVIESEQALEAILKSMRDGNAMVREYAVKNLARLANRPREYAFHNRIVETLIDCIDDDSEVVRIQVYSALGRYKWSYDLVSVFLKGMADASDSIRLISVQNLNDMDVDSPYVRSSLVDATDDISVDVRRYACLAIQKFPGPESIEVLTRVLREDSESTIRALAAESLSRMEDRNAMNALIQALEKDKTEDVQLAVLRALGKRRGWEIEETLLATLNRLSQDVESTSPPLIWTCIRSLGAVGGTEHSINALNTLRKKTASEIILMAIDMSYRKISSRVDELKQLERQLEAATPTTTAIPTEYDEELPVIEDERNLELDRARRRF